MVNAIHSHLLWSSCRACRGFIADLIHELSSVMHVSLMFLLLFNPFERTGRKSLKPFPLLSANLLLVQLLNLTSEPLRFVHRV